MNRMRGKQQFATDWNDQAQLINTRMRYLSKKNIKTKKEVALDVNEIKLMEFTNVLFTC